MKSSPIVHLRKTYFALRKSMDKVDYPSSDTYLMRLDRFRKAWTASRLAGFDPTLIANHLNKKYGRVNEI